VRGGNFKFRALRLDHGNYSWAGEAVTRKTRILKVVYNSTNNELVRTNTLVKGSIIQIDSTPYKAWYLQYYNIDLSNKKEIAAAVAVPKEIEKVSTSKKPQAKKEEKGQAKKEEPKAKLSQKRNPQVQRKKRLKRLKRPKRPKRPKRLKRLKRLKRPKKLQRAKRKLPQKQRKAVKSKKNNQNPLLLPLKENLNHRKTGLKKSLVNRT